MPYLVKREYRKFKLGPQGFKLRSRGAKGGDQEYTDPPDALYICNSSLSRAPLAASYIYSTNLCLAKTFYVGE